MPEFPTSFPLKVIGKNEDGFEELVVAIVLRHVPNLSIATVRSRPSKDNTYLAVSVTIKAETKDQLDNIYRDLSAEGRVLFAL